MRVQQIADGSSLEEKLVSAVHSIFGVLAQLPADTPLALGLCGGRSVVGLLKAFAQASVNYPRDLMQRIHFFMVDERIVPLSHPDSNFGGLKAQLFDQLISEGIIGHTQLHPFIASVSDAPQQCQEYYKELQRFGGKFAAVVVGVGEDGHVAGLFPHHPVLQHAHPGFQSFLDSPKPPSERMTATKALIQDSSLAVLLVLGEGKRQAWNEFSSQKNSIENCPARMVKTMKQYVVVTDLAGS